MVSPTVRRGATPTAPGGAEQEHTVLEAIREKYLGQSINEFLESGGDAREYAHLVFTNQLGWNDDPTAPDLGILTETDLAYALEQLVEQRNDALAATEGQP